MNSSPPAQEDPRAAAALAWAQTTLNRLSLTQDMIAGDASFRRYFRLTHGQESWVLMDAPPAKEDSAPFIDVAGRLAQAGLVSPTVIAADLENGFLLLDDLGDELYRSRITPASGGTEIPGLLKLLARIATKVDATGLPDYSESLLQQELELFPDWYLRRHKGVTLTCEDWDLWENLSLTLIRHARSQPQVFVHRDFHSCNLLHTPAAETGIIDFQDAVRGPLTYDFASLVWDRYISWPRSLLEQWMEDFRQQVAPSTEPAQWRLWCDMIGLQRNLKIVGIFARLHYRDGKDGYLAMIPRFWSYVRDTLALYPEFAEFDNLLEKLRCAP